MNQRKTKLCRARKRRGISAALGALIFLLIAVSIIVSLAFIISEQGSYNLAVKKTSELVTMRGKEHLKAYTASSNTIQISNDGSITSKIVGLLEADNSNGKLGLNQLSIMVSPGQKYEYSYQIPSGKDRKAGVLTSMGNVFWVDPNAPPDYPTADFSLSAIPSLVTVQQGGTSSASVTVGSINGYSRPVSLSVTGTAEGVTYSFQPGGGTPTFQSILTITASASTPAGIYPVTVFGDDGTGKVRSSSFTLQVNSPLNQDFTLNVSPKTVALQQSSAGSITITLQPLNGYSGTVSLSASGFPSGVAYSFNPLSAIPPFTSTLSIDVGSAAPVGTYTVSIVGTDGYLTHQDIFTLQVSPQPDFALSVTPSMLSLDAGASGAASVTVQELNGYSGSVVLSLSGLPSGASYSFNPSSEAPSFTSTLTINTGTANSGTYALTITGTGTTDYRIHTASLMLAIVSPFDFSTSVSPPSGSVGQGGSISTAVTILQQSGSTTQLVSLSATGGPSGTSYTFSPQSGYPAFTSTLNIAVPSNAPTGTYSITVSSSAGGLTRIASYSLTVTAMQDFSIALSSSSVSVQQGGSSSASNTATVTPVNGYSNLVSLSSSGAPSGVTISLSPSSGTPAFSSTISISASASAAPGIYPITITGVGSDGKTHSILFTLQVLALYKLTVAVSPQQTGSSSDFIYDTFASDLSGWSYTGSSGYTLSLDSSNGQPAPSARISGDNYNTLLNGMRKTVDISTWTGGSLTLTFNWRATSSWAGSEVTNANLRIEDADTGQSLYVERLIGGGVYDTGWRSYSKDISTYAAGHARIRIVLYLYDSWGSNWGQMNRYDNIKLAGLGGGSSSSSGTTNPSPGTYSYQSGQQVQVTALPYSGWVFSNWLMDGSNSGTANPTTVTMNQDHSLTAVFTKGSSTQDFTVSANPSSVTVQTGSSSSTTVIVSSLGGYSSTVSLSLSGLPSGVSYTFNPSSSVPTYSSTLTINTAGSATTGTYLLTVTGTDSDGKVRSTGITLTVAASLDFSVSVSPASGSVQQGGSVQTTVTTTLTGGSTQVISLSASGLPDGATYRFDPDSGSPTFQSALSIATSAESTTPAGTYSITVTATGGGLARTATYALTVTQAPQPFDFSLSIDPSSGSAPQTGGTIQSTVTVALLAGSSSSSQAVSLSASSEIPQGLTVSFDPASGSPDFTSTMTLSVGADIIPTGTYTITITGTGGGLTRSTTYTLTITDVPDFTVSVLPSSFSISQGSSGSTTVTVSALNGYSNPVTLSASNLPAGVLSSYSFSPQNGYPSYTSTLTLSASSTATPGTYSITITGTGSDGTSRSTTLSLAIQETSNILTILVKDQFNSPVQGIQVTIDSTAYSTDANGQVVQPTTLGSHTVSVESVYSPSVGIRHLYVQWSDGTTSNPRTVTVSGSTTYTAQTKKQYYLTTDASPSNGGWVSPSSSWYDAGAGVSISAAAYSGYMFESWTGTGTGAYSGANNPASVTMNSDLHETASFQQVSTITVKTLATYGSLSTTTPLSGIAVTIGGSTVRTDADGIATFTVSNGGTYQISLTDTSKTVAASAVDVRNFQFMWWEDLSTSNSRSMTVNGPATYTAYYPISWQQYTLKPSTFTLEVADPSNTDPLGNPVLRAVTLPYSNSYSNWLQGWEWQDEGWTDTNGAYFGAHNYATWGYSNPWTFKWSSTFTPATHVYPVSTLTTSYTGSLSVNGVSSDSAQGLYFRYRDTYNDKGDTSPSPDWSNTRSFSGSLSAAHVFSPNQVITGDLLTFVFLWAEGSNFEMRYSQGYGWTTNSIVVTLHFSPANP